MAAPPAMSAPPTGSARSALVRRVWRLADEQPWRSGVPLGLLVAACRSRAARLLLVGLWAWVWALYRRESRRETAIELQRMATVEPVAFRRHYDERVPTTEQELDLWGAYHRHRHEMRYDLVAAAVRRALPPGGVVLDVGGGSGLVADRISDLDATYLATDLAVHHSAFGAGKPWPVGARLRRSFAAATAEQLPLADASVDVVVLSEVIEHLVRPELAVWEIARVLRTGGVLVLTTNNASELPLRSPLSHLLPWLEKAVGATRPGLVTRRPWVWPEPVDPLLTGGAEVWLPHTHHIYGETRALLAAGGLAVTTWSTFEFPPPQSRTARFLDARGDAGRRVVDVVERVCRALPGVRRMGCHLYLEARRTAAVLPPEPLPGLWPGPFSQGFVEGG